MHKIKLKFEGEVMFSTTMTVRVSDINYGGHVGNDRFVSIIHEARVRWLNSIGYKSELDIDGLGLIQKDLAVDYKKEVKYGQDLTINLSVAQTYRYGFTLFYRLSAEDEEVAVAFTNLLFYDYSSLKLSHIPDDFLSNI